MIRGSRGMLTPEIKAKAEKYLGREFTQKELRLYPYMQFCMINSQRIERARTDEEEQEILKTLEREGRIKREYPSYFHPTCEFWMFMNDILAGAYIETAEEYMELSSNKENEE